MEPTHKRSQSSPSVQEALAGNGADHADDVTKAGESSRSQDTQGREKPFIRGRTMEELKDAYSDEQVVDLLATAGVQHLGTMKLRDGVMVRGFNGEQIIWETHEKAEDAPWKEIWDKRLESARATTPITPCQYWTADAFVVTLKNAASAWEKGLLHPIVQMYEARKCPISIFSSPVVRAVVWYKWHWARTVVFGEFCLFFFWLIAFLIHATAYEQDDLRHGFWELKNQGFRQSLAVFTSLIATIFMLPFSYISICEVLYNGLRHWLTFWNLFDALAQICQVIVFIMFFFGTGVSSNTYKIMLSVQTVLLVLKIQYFSRAVLQVECAFIDSLNHILREAAMFLILWVTIVMSFAVALYNLFKKDIDIYKDNRELAQSGESIDTDQQTELEEINFYYGSIFHSFFTLFGSMFKRFTYDPLLNSERSIAVTSLFSIFLFLNTVTFYNLIVSIVVSSHKKIKERSQARLDTGRAQMLVELETAIPKGFLSSSKKSYIHFLKLAPQPDIALNSRWLSLGFSGKTADSQKEALTRRLNEAQIEIMNEIDELCSRVASAKRKAYLTRRYSKSA